MTTAAEVQACPTWCSGEHSWAQPSDGGRLHCAEVRDIVVDGTVLVCLELQRWDDDEHGIQPATILIAHDENQLEVSIEVADTIPDLIAACLRDLVTLAKSR